MKIFVGADHRGYELKQKVVQWLFEEKRDFQDMGADFIDSDDDYTTYADKVASMVADTEGSRGILLCGSGVGVDVVANKFDGVRASIGIGSKQIEAGRADDDMNILVLAADFVSEDSAKKMVKAFLETKFERASRHIRRLDEIKKIEENN